MNSTPRYVRLVLVSSIAFTLGCSGARAKSEAPQAAIPDTASAEPTRLVWMDGFENAYPRWSNDGRQILFQSNRDGKWQLYVMDADGKNERRITDGKFNDNFPDWSPDNRSVAFVSDRTGNEDVYVMNMNGSGLTSVAPDSARDLHPYWAPDGRSLLFNSMRDAGTRFQVYSVRPDGSGLKRLTTSVDDQTCARLSPDGTRMVWLANLPTGRDDIFVADSLARAEVNVTDDMPANGWPTWTPDGARIVYASGASTFSLWSMKPDGTDRRRLTHPASTWTDARPSVSPDGRRIVFNRAQGKTIGIYVLGLER